MTICKHEDLIECVVEAQAGRPGPRERVQVELSVDGETFDERRPVTGSARARERYSR